MFKVIGNLEKKEKFSKEEIGNKAINLIKLDNLNLTSNFLIIPTTICKEHICKIKNKNDVAKIKNEILKLPLNKSIINEIHKTLKELKINNNIILRSSYPYEDTKQHSFAGIFNSYKITNLKHIEFYIKKIWSNLYSEKVLSYIKANKISIQNHNIAIIIQQYVEHIEGAVILGTKKNKKLITIIETSKNIEEITSGQVKYNNSFLLILSEVPFISNIQKDNSFSKILKHLFLQETYYSFYNSMLTITKRYNFYDIELCMGKDKKIYILQIRELSSKSDLFNLKNYKYYINNSCLISITDSNIKLLNHYISNFSSKLKLKKLYFKKEKQDLVFCKLKDMIIFDEGIAIKIKNKKFILNFNDYVISSIKKFENLFKDLSNLNEYKIFSMCKAFLFFVNSFEFIYEILVEKLYFYLYKKYSIDINRFIDFLPHECKINYENLNKINLNLLYIKGYNYKQQIAILLNFKQLIDIFRNNYIGKNINQLFNTNNFLFKRIKDTNLFFYFHPNELKNKRKLLYKTYKLEQYRKDSYHNSSSVTSFPLIGLLAYNSHKQVIGKVFKIESEKDISKFKKNYILLSKFTNINYIPAMLKAKAILTEHGGLTSHAAIVSRELKKHCIVGIDNLMQAFKNNDKIKIINNKIYKIK